MRWIIIVIALGTVLAVGLTQMEYMRCDGKFVLKGASQDEVLERCGDPVHRESDQKERVALGGPRINFEGQYVLREEPEETVQVMTFSETWTYNIGEKVYILTFTGEREGDNMEDEPELLLKKIRKL